MSQDEINWPEALRATDSGEQAAAVSALRRVLLDGLRIALRGRTDVSEAQLEDFAQEGLLRVLAKLDQFAGRSKFVTWAHAIAVNTAFAELRRKRWQDVSLDALLAQGERLPAPEVMADDALGADEDRKRLMTALRHSIEKDLTPKQRAGIIAELREMPFDQIAELLGTNRNAAYKLLHDARRVLKIRLLEAGFAGRDIHTAFTV